MNFMQGAGMRKQGFRFLIALIGSGVMAGQGSEASAAEGQIPGASGVIYACIRLDRDSVPRQ
jgi:hypothetical protein